MANVEIYPNGELADYILNYYADMRHDNGFTAEDCTTDFASTIAYVFAEFDRLLVDEDDAVYVLTRKGKETLFEIMREKVMRCEATLEEYQEYLALKDELDEYDKEYQNRTDWESYKEYHVDLKNER